MEHKIKKVKSKIEKPRVIVFSGYGLNCEEETKFAFESAGGKADIVHINDLIANPKILSEYQIIALPGGFSYGDDTGSGKAYANKIRNHLSKELKEFLSRDTLMIGICNGFQILASLNILPGALTYNKNGKYIDRWVDLKIEGKSPWLSNIKKISLPIAHGEGRYIISEKEYKKMKKSREIAFTYTKGEICNFQSLEKNPNGAKYDIAGVLGYNGRVLGMMPHPERAIFPYHSPLWQIKKARGNFKKNNLPHSKNMDMGDGILLFQNAVDYFKK